MPTTAASVPSFRIGTPPSPQEGPRLLSANWRAEYYNNDSLKGSPMLVRNENRIDYEWRNDSPASKEIAVDNFSARWTATIELKATRYRFTAKIDDGVRLYIDGRLVIDQWRSQSGEYSYDIEFPTIGYPSTSGDSHTIVMEYVERSGKAMARLFVQEERLSIGNLITCVGHSGKVGVKLYRLDQKQQWYPVGGGGIANDAGYLKINALLIDAERFGSGEPYRIEQWINGQLAQSTGNYQAGEPEFLMRTGDNHTPWGCPR